MWGFAAFDLLGTAALAWLLGRGVLGRRPSGGEYLIAFLVLMLVSVGVHEAFCTRTRLAAILFGRPWPPAEQRGKCRLVVDT